MFGERLYHLTNYCTSLVVFHLAARVSLKNAFNISGKKGVGGCHTNFPLKTVILSQLFYLSDPSEDHSEIHISAYPEKV